MFGPLNLLPRRAQMKNLTTIPNQRTYQINDRKKNGILNRNKRVVANNLNKAINYPDQMKIKQQQSNESIMVSNETIGIVADDCDRYNVDEDIDKNNKHVQNDVDAGENNEFYNDDDEYENHDNNIDLNEVNEENEDDQELLLHRYCHVCNNEYVNANNDIINSNKSNLHKLNSSSKRISKSKINAIKSHNDNRKNIKKHELFLNNDENVTLQRPSRVMNTLKLLTRGLYEGAKVVASITASTYVSHALLGATNSSGAVLIRNTVQSVAEILGASYNMPSAVDQLIKDCPWL